MTTGPMPAPVFPQLQPDQVDLLEADPPRTHRQLVDAVCEALGVIKRPTLVTETLALTPQAVVTRQTTVWVTFTRGSATCAIVGDLLIASSLLGPPASDYPWLVDTVSPMLSQRYIAYAWQALVTPSMGAGWEVLEPPGLNRLGMVQWSARRTLLDAADAIECVREQLECPHHFLLTPGQLERWEQLRTADNMGRD